MLRKITSNSIKSSMAMSRQLMNVNSTVAIKNCYSNSGLYANTLIRSTITANMNQSRQFAILSTSMGSMTKEILEEKASIINDDKISSQLKNSDTYTYRHIGNSEISSKKALNFLGVSSIDELMDQVVPDTIRLKESAMFKHNGRELIGIDSETLMLERMR